MPPPPPPLLQGTLPLASVPSQVYQADNGTAFTVPIVPPAPSGAGLDVTLTVMQIRTFLCTV